MHVLEAAMASNLMLFAKQREVYAGSEPLSSIRCVVSLAVAFVVIGLFVLAMDGLSGKASAVRIEVASRAHAS